MATQLNLKNQAGKTFKSQLLLETSNPVADPMEIVAQSSAIGGLNKPRLRWNETTSKWQFSNDGAAYTDIGSSTSAPTFTIVTESLAAINNGDLALVIITENYAAVTANKAAVNDKIRGSNTTLYNVYSMPFTEDSFAKAIIWSQRTNSLVGPFLQLATDTPHAFFGDNTVISIVVGVAQNTVGAGGLPVAVSIGQNTFSVAGAANFNVGDFIFFDNTDFIRKNNSLPFNLSTKLVFSGTVVLGPPPTYSYYAQAMLSSTALDLGSSRSREEFRAATVWGLDNTAFDSSLLPVAGVPSTLAFGISTDFSGILAGPPGTFVTAAPAPGPYMANLSLTIRIYGINAAGALKTELITIGSATVPLVGGLAIFGPTAETYKKVLFVMVSFNDTNSVATGLYITLSKPGGAGIAGFCRLKAPTTGFSTASGNFYFGGVPIGSIYTKSTAAPNTLPFEDIDILPNPDPYAHTAIYLNFYQNILETNYPVGCRHCLVSVDAATGLTMQSTLSAFSGGDLFYSTGNYAATAGAVPYVRQLSDVFMTSKAPAGNMPMFYSLAYFEDGAGPYSLMMPFDYVNMGATIDTTAATKAIAAINDFALSAYLGYYGQGQVVGINGTDVTVNIFNPIGWYGYAGNFNFLDLLGII